MGRRLSSAVGAVLLCGCFQSLRRVFHVFRAKRHHFSSQKHGSVHSLTRRLFSIMSTKKDSKQVKNNKKKTPGCLGRTKFCSLEE